LTLTVLFAILNCK